MSIKELKAAIADLPDDMPVAINEHRAEATGLVESVKVVDGSEDCPYDKGYDIYSVGEYMRKRGRINEYSLILPTTKVCFLNT
jgi:hypothetical protein